jgi:hypothetical protein
MKLRTRIVAMLATLFSIGLAASDANAQVRVTIGSHPRVYRETVVRPYYGYRHDYGRHNGYYMHHRLDRDYNGTYRRDFDNRNYDNRIYDNRNLNNYRR